MKSLRSKLIKPFLNLPTTIAKHLGDGAAWSIMTSLYISAIVFFLVLYVFLAIPMSIGKLIDWAHDRYEGRA